MELWNPTKEDTSITLESDVWIHIAMTYDGDGRVQFFKNGVASTMTLSTDGDLATPDTGDVVIGAEIDKNEGVMGMIKDLRIYDKALSDVEITAAMTNDPLSTSDFFSILDTQRLLVLRP